MEKIIILGNGQLGSYIYKNWKLDNYEVDVIDYPEFDITDQNKYEKWRKSHHTESLYGGYINSPR